MSSPMRVHPKFERLCEHLADEINNEIKKHGRTKRLTKTDITNIIAEKFNGNAKIEITIRKRHRPIVHDVFEGGF